MAGRALHKAITSFRFLGNQVHLSYLCRLGHYSGDNGASTNTLPWGWVAVATAVTGVAYGAHSSCDSNTPMQNVKLANYRQWLENHGADLSSISLNSYTAEKGTGMQANDDVKRKYAKNMWARITNWFRPNRHAEIGSFPLSLLINQHTIIDDPLLGDVLQSHLSAGHIDGQKAVMLWLLTHRRMGNISPFEPYINILPRHFNTPLYYSDEQMQNLAGTSLQSGVQTTLAALSRSLDDVQPIARELQAKAGAVPGFMQRDYTYEDWKWAFSVFWSRCMDLQGDGFQSSGASVPSLVPGLDMANHDPDARCYWELEMNGGGSAGRVKFMAQVRGGPRGGDEVCIRYGDSGNDALMFMHGFADMDNQNDAVLVAFPLPKVNDWDDVLRARVLLLQEFGLGPQIILMRPKKGQKAVLSPSNRKALDVFVMHSSELAKEFEAAVDEDVKKHVDQVPTLGQDMAIYTTFCTLLDVKLQELEGPSGTGTLQSDIELLEAGQGSMADDVWHCIVYRAGQKRILRQYLADARQKLQQIMNEMHAVKDSEAKPK